MLDWVILLLFGTSFLHPLSLTCPLLETVLFPYRGDITGSLYPIITTAQIPSGFSLIYSGAGPIGLVTALAAHAAGCTPIVLTDLVQSRLEFAKTLLPNIRTVQITKGQSPEEVAGMIKTAAGGMVNVALECTGFESSIRTAIFVSHDEGRRSEEREE
jgi:threonine dehydrogenase-like Zn-dependent dehydrogenase